MPAAASLRQVQTGTPRSITDQQPEEAVAGIGGGGLTRECGPRGVGTASTIHRQIRGQRRSKGGSSGMLWRGPNDVLGWSNGVLGGVKLAKKVDSFHATQKT